MKTAELHTKQREIRWKLAKLLLSALFYIVVFAGGIVHAIVTLFRSPRIQAMFYLSMATILVWFVTRRLLVINQAIENLTYKIGRLRAKAQKQEK